MICPPCRAGSHLDCPELGREHDPVLLGGQWCDCAHEERDRSHGAAVRAAQAGEDP